MPAISSVIPNTAQCGEPAQLFAVYGDGFINGTTLITVDGANYPTVFVSANKLTTIGVDPSLRTQPGFVKIGVVGDTNFRYLQFTPFPTHYPTVAAPTRSNWYDVTP